MIFFYIKHLHAQVNIKLTITSHMCTMICLGIKKNNSKKNKTINLPKIYKTAILNLKKVNIIPFRDKKEIYGGI